MKKKKQAINKIPVFRDLVDLQGLILIQKFTSNHFLFIFIKRKLEFKISIELYLINNY